MGENCDLVLINPGDKRQVYQDLAADFSATEPPVRAAVLAAYLRNQGFDILIIDANAENITIEETTARVEAIKPHLAAVIVYG